MRMRNNNVIWLFILVLVVLSACSSSTPEPTELPAETQSVEPQETEEVEAEPEEEVVSTEEVSTGEIRRAAGCGCGAARDGSGRNHTNQRNS